MRSIRSMLLLGLALTLGCAHAGPPRSDGGLSDEEIAAVMRAAHTGEVQLSEIGLDRARSETARAFAGALLSQHTAAMERDRALLERLAIRPRENSLSRQLTDESQRVAATLRAVPDAEVDGAFLLAQTRLHRQVQKIIEEELLPRAQDPALRGELENMRGQVAWLWSPSSATIGTRRYARK